MKHVLCWEVAPAQARNESGDNESYGQEHLDVPTMLELDDRVACKVAHVGNTGLPAGLENHPADATTEDVVRPIWVEVGIGVAVMSAMPRRPPLIQPWTAPAPAKARAYSRGLEALYARWAQRR